MGGHSNTIPAMTKRSLLAILPVMTLVAGSPAEQVPDFRLEDTNTASLRFGAVVSPRDYVLQVCGFYFGTAST